MSPARRRCRRCANPLARDNADTLCSACEQQRPRDLAPDVPAEFWHTALVGAALASGDLGRVIRMYRFHPSHRRPLTQASVANWLYVSQATLSRIEHGKRHLTIDEVDSFTRALGMPLSLRWTANPSEVRDDVDPISRRSLFGEGIGAALGLSATTVPAVAREIDPELVAHWMKLMSVLIRHDAMFGSHDVLATVRHELDLIAQHRRLTHGELRTEFLHMESRWSEFASFLSNDVGDPHIRDYWADRSLRLAQEAGYHDMVAWVFMRRSEWAAAQHNAQRATTLADAAGRTPGTSMKIRALCAMREAQGHALANDTAACERSLADAHGVLNRSDTDDDDPPSDLGRRDADPTYVLAAEACCWLSLRPRRAISMFEDVLRLWPSARTRGRGVQQARLAFACAAANEPDRAAAEGIKALGIAQSTKSDVTVRELKRLDRRLAACDLPAAADFREAFAAL